VIFWILNLAFPPPELGRQVDIDVSTMLTPGVDPIGHGRSVEGKSDSEVEANDTEKGFRESVV
jgi:hypothetical protein